MEWFKGCKTNVHLAEDLLKTHFYVYTGFEAAEASKPYELVAELRRLGILCAAASHEVWVFRALESELVQLVDTDAYGFGVGSRGTVENGLLERSADGRVVKDLLLASIEGAVSFTLAKQYGVLRIGTWAWAFQDSEGSEPHGASSVILQLHVEFSDSGALYLTTNTHASDLHALSENDCSCGCDLILAPSGNNAKLVSSSLAISVPRAFSSDAWKTEVSTSLHSEGIKVTVDDIWLLVQLESVGRTSRCMWPAALCLASVQSIERSGFTCSSWKQWFAATEDHGGFRDPLSVAEEWFAGAAERKKAAAAATTLSSSSEAVGAIAAISTLSPELSGSLATSPPFLQRVADQQAAMSGIYPTPPDGLVPASASQHATSDAMTAPPTVDPSNDLLPSDDDLRPRLHSSDSSDGPQPFAPVPDDLFGDMDFGTNEVGDADFSFFDEPDEAPASSPSDEAAMDEVVPSVSGRREGPHQADAADDMMPASDAMVTETPQVEAEYLPEENAAIAAEVTPIPPDDQPMLDIGSASIHKAEKPLSPSGIKQRLMPPLSFTSASGDQSLPSLKHQRSSTFEALVFRDDLEVDLNYAREYAFNDSDIRHDYRTAKMSLPPERKKLRIRQLDEKDAHEPDQGSESEEDSQETVSSPSEEGLPPKLPWETMKRKRTARLDPLADSFGRMLSDQDDDDVGSDINVRDQMSLLLRMTTLSEMSKTSKSGISLMNANSDCHGNTPSSAEGLPAIEQVVDGLAKVDLVYIAQLVVNQANTSTARLMRDVGCLDPYDSDTKLTATSFRTLLDCATAQILPELEPCDISSLALIREPPSRALSNPASTRPGQPRPVQRSDSATLGPDIFPIPPPFFRVRRGPDTYEMLPPALEFWETLSLAPSNGAKDIRAFCVLPVNEDLQKLADSFLSELGSAYESCKLGSHIHVRNVSEDAELDDYEDGLASVEIPSDAEENLEAAIRAYSNVCDDLGIFLSSIGHLEPERTIVVYMLNPFRHPRAVQYLCACFRRLQKAYRDHAPKAQRNSRRSDIIVQIIPVGLVAVDGTLVSLNAKQLSLLAKEVYDRCPPATSEDAGGSSTLPGYTAPFVELASAPPKRIGFQLTAEPPNDLLHEGSVLHIAFAVSKDEQWLTVSWVDGTGRFSSTTTHCLCGKSFAEVADDVWDRVRDILASREVTWRVFVLTAGNVDPSIRYCWRKLAGSWSRKQPFSVTLLSANLDPTMRLTPPESADDDVEAKTSGLGASFLTPVTTPQGATFSVSPDTSGLSNAPPTPVPSESVAIIADNDPDAHLIDTADESWGVLYASTSADTELAKGALIKRGAKDGCRAEAGEHLPCLEVSLLWTVQVRPNGVIDEGNAKQSEMTLREVLRMYRNLSVLTAARGIRAVGSVEQVWPCHLVAALRGAAGIDAFLS